MSWIRMAPICLLLAQPWEPLSPSRQRRLPPAVCLSGVRSPRTAHTPLPQVSPDTPANWAPQLCFLHPPLHLRFSDKLRGLVERLGQGGGGGWGGLRCSISIKRLDADTAHPEALLRPPLGEFNLSPFSIPWSPLWQPRLTDQTPTKGPRPRLPLLPLPPPIPGPLT